jgi:hypothetical protein
MSFGGLADARIRKAINVKMASFVDLGNDWIVFFN